MTITRENVYLRLKQVLAEKTGKQSKDIRAEHVLTGELGFTIPGKRALSTSINKAFSDVGANVTPDDCAGAETVGNLADTVWKKTPEMNKG